MAGDRVVALLLLVLVVGGNSLPFRKGDEPATLQPTVESVESDLEEQEEAYAPPTWWQPWDSVLTESTAGAANGTAGSSSNSSAVTGATVTGPTVHADNMTTTADMTDQERQKVALMTLYHETGGSRWAKNGGWLTTSDHCTWAGVTCSSAGMVTELYLPFNRLIGVLNGATIGSLTTLTKLDLSKNYISGSLPSELGNLVDMKELSLHNNHFSGALPGSLMVLSKLTFLDVHNNLLAGELPSTLGSLVALEQLYLQDNEFEGSIPTSVKTFVALRGFDVSRNRLTGEIPAEVAGMVSLEDFSVKENKLSGQLPAAAFESMPKLVYVRMNNNQLTGSIPSMVGNKDIAQIDLSNNKLTGSIPELGGTEGLPQLVLLDLSHNDLSGEIPNSLALSKRIRRLNLSYNRLVGGIPTTLDLMHDLTELYLQHNQLSGSIPDVMGTQLRHILFLNLSYNRLSGNIPSTLNQIHKLRSLNLSNNMLSGSLPTALAEWGSVVSINLENNKLEGRLAEEFGKMPTLEVLKLSGNLMASKSHFLPSFVVRDNSVQVRNETGHFACTALKGDSSTHLVKLTLDPSYHNYHQCVCANDYYGNPPDCQNCPYHAHCENGQVICDPDYFSYPDTPHVCLECPEGAECPGGSRIYPKAGYWRSNETTLSFWECANDEACLGGEDSLCDVGYEGPLCAVCESGYFSRGIYRCTKCPAEELILLYVVVFCLAGACFILMVLRIRTIFWMAKLKILVGFLQMIAVLDLAYDAHWPSAFLEFLWMFSFMNTDFIQVTILDCPSFLNPLQLHFDYYFSLLLVVVAPVITISFIIGYWMIRCLWRCLFPTDPRFDSIWFKRFMQRVKRWIWLVLLIVYPGVTGKLFRFFKCRKLETGEWWLKTDYATTCYDTKYWGYSSVAFAGLLGYTLLVPIVLLIVLLWNYRRLQTEEFVKIHLGPVYLDYKPGYWWWEFVDLFRKVLLGALVVFFIDKKESQFTAALIISLVFLLVHLVLKPYRVEHDHWFMFLVHLGMHIAFMLGLAVVVKANIVVTTLVAWCLIGFFMMIILMPIFFFFFRHVCARPHDSEALEEYYGKVVRPAKQYSYAIVSGRPPNYPEWVVDDQAARGNYGSHAVGYDTDANSVREE